MNFFDLYKAIGVVTVGGKPQYSSSPKATGVAGKFNLKPTASGKTVSSYSHKEHGKDWSAHDHADAFRAHMNHIASLDEHGTHPKLIQHHREAAEHHWNMANTDVKKAHRSTVIGHTRSGHTVHRNVHSKHAHHSGWSKRDHSDAANVHSKRALRIARSIESLAGHSGKYSKLLSALKKVLKMHTRHATSHHAVAHGGK